LASDLYGYSREEALSRVTHELLRAEFPEPLERINEQLLREAAGVANSFTDARTAPKS
jgi:hypothetical protein